MKVGLVMPIDDESLGLIVDLQPPTPAAVERLAEAVRVSRTGAPGA